MVRLHIHFSIDKLNKFHVFMQWVHYQYSSLMDSNLTACFSVLAGCTVRGKRYGHWLLATDTAAAPCSMDDWCVMVPPDDCRLMCMFHGWSMVDCCVRSARRLLNGTVAHSFFHRQAKYKSLKFHVFMQWVHYQYSSLIDSNLTACFSVLAGCKR